jgi:hypothetical protein
MDVASFMGSIGKPIKDFYGNVSAHQGSNESKTGESHKKMKQKDVDQFLGRMEQAELRRAQTLIHLIKNPKIAILGKIEKITVLANGAPS